jgi:hypothetical protein
MSALFTDAVLIRSLLLFLLLGSFAGLLAGMALLLRPEWLQRISKRSNRWVSTRQMGRSMGKEINVDHWFYRYGHLSGILLLAGALYIIYKLTSQISRGEMLINLVRLKVIPAIWASPLLDTLVLFFLAGAVAAAIISLFLIFRPSMLREMELGANQNVSMRQSLKPMEIERGNVDQLVYEHGRLVGALLLGGSLYALVVLLNWVMR